MSKFGQWVRLTREVLQEACGEYADEEIEALASYLYERACAATDSDVAVDLGTLGDALKLPQKENSDE